MSLNKKENIRLKNELLCLFSDTTGIDKKKLTGATSFYTDIGLDSMAILKMVTIIENRYKIELDEDQLDLLDNLDSAYKYIDYLITRNGT